MDDSRRHRRISVSIQVHVRVNPKMERTIHLCNKVFQAKVVDVSVSGLGLVSDIFLPTGVLLDFVLPRTGFRLPNQPPAAGFMRITGEVVYARSHEGKCRIGVSITWIEETDRRLIQAFIEA